MKIVELHNINKIYDNNTNIRVQALDNVNMYVEKGEFLAVIGPSGSGKSTLLHLIGGLEKQTEGSIKVNGKELDNMKEDELADYRRKEVGFVFQKYNLIPMLNAKENIELPLFIGNEETDKSYFNELIDFLQLKDRLAHMPGELSGGQQQRVAIARALITKPSIVLADEPTGNLDQKASEEVMSYFRKIGEKLGQTIIMITHNISLAKMADRVINIVDGSISMGNVIE